MYSIASFNGLRVCFVLFVLTEVFERRKGGKGETDKKESVSIKLNKESFENRSRKSVRQNHSRDIILLLD